MYRNLINVNCATITEVFRHIKDFMVSRDGIANYSLSGIGWDVHDSYYAGGNQDAPAENDWLVISSPGENGKQALYYRMVFTSLANGIIQTRAGLFWNTATDAWVKPFHSADISGGPSSGGPFQLWIYGSLDRFSIIIGNGSTLVGRHFGLAVDTMHDQTVATTAAAVSAGTNVVVAVDAVPASWAVGKAVFIRDLANIERAVLSAISGNNVTLTLANGYAAGARIARDYSVFISSSTNFLSGGYGQIGRNGGLGSIFVGGTNESIALLEADPDALAGCHATNYTEWYAPGSGKFGRAGDILNVSSTGITNGNAYQDDTTGDNYRALLVSGKMYLFREV